MFREANEEETVTMKRFLDTFCDASRCDASIEKYRVDFSSNTNIKSETKYVLTYFEWKQNMILVSISGYLSGPNWLAA